MEKELTKRTFNRLIAAVFATGMVAGGASINILMNWQAERAHEGHKLAKSKSMGNDVAGFYEIERLEHDLDVAVAQTEYQPADTDSAVAAAVPTPLSGQGDAVASAAPLPSGTPGTVGPDPAAEDSSFHPLAGGTDADAAAAAAQQAKDAAKAQAVAKAAQAAPAPVQADQDGKTGPEVQPSVAQPSAPVSPVVIVAAGQAAKKPGAETLNASLIQTPTLAQLSKPVELHVEGFPLGAKPIPMQVVGQAQPLIAAAASEPDTAGALAPSAAASKPQVVSKAKPVAVAKVTPKTPAKAKPVQVVMNEPLPPPPPIPPIPPGMREGLLNGSSVLRTLSEQMPRGATPVRRAQARPMSDSRSDGMLVVNGPGNAPEGDLVAGQDDGVESDGMRNAMSGFGGNGSGIHRAAGSSRPRTSGPVKVVTVIKNSIIVSNPSTGQFSQVKVGEKLPSGATLVSINDRDGTVKTDRGDLHVEK